MTKTNFEKIEQTKKSIEVKTIRTHTKTRDLTQTKTKSHHMSDTIETSTTENMKEKDNKQNNNIHRQAQDMRETAHRRTTKTMEIQHLSKTIERWRERKENDHSQTG